jgi:hypothetical protein
MPCDNNSTIQSKISVIGSVSGSQLTLDFEQAAHGFRVGDVVRYDDSYGGFTLAQANTAENSEVTGVVRELQGDTKVFMVIEGIIPIGGFTFARDPNATLGTWSGYTASTFFLSGTTAGLLDSTPPEESGSVIKPTMINMGTVGGQQYGIVKNFVGNQIGGNASASVHGISPVGSIVPYVGYSTNVPSGFTSCKGGFVSPSVFTTYNKHIGGKFGYKMRVGITGDQTINPDTGYNPTDVFVKKLYDSLITSGGSDFGDAQGTTLSNNTNTRRPRFRQEFPGTRPKWDLRNENDVFVVQGDVVEVSKPFVAGTLNTSHGPYYIDVEVTPDNQVDLPRLLWAEKYGNESYSPGPNAQYGRALNAAGFYPKIRSSFMANYTLEEAIDITESDDPFGFGPGKRTKVFRQDNTGSHGYINAGAGLNSREQVDESHLNSYTQERTINSNDELYGDGSKTSSPRKINASVVPGDDHIPNVIFQGDLVQTGEITNAPNYDGPRPHNEREIVSYISETIGAPLPFNKTGRDGTATEDYNTGVRTYIVVEGPDGFINYEDFSKRIGGIDKNTIQGEDEFSHDLFKIHNPGRGTDDAYRIFLLNTSNGTGIGNEIDTITLEGIGIPDLRDRYLKGPVEPDDVFGTKVALKGTPEEDAYAVIQEYDGGVGQRGGTNRTHSQKLLSVSHASSPSTDSMLEHRRHLELMGVRGYGDCDAGNQNLFDIWASPNLCWGTEGGAVNAWTGLYRHNEHYTIHDQRPPDGDGTLIGLDGTLDGPGIYEQSLGYGRIVGDDGLYNPAGMYKWNDQYVMLPWNRDRYHRVDTPGIVTDTVFTPRHLRLPDGTPNPDDGIFLKDDFSNHKEYNVISRDGGGAGTLFGFAGFGYNPVMGIDPEFVKKYDNLLSGDSEGGFVGPPDNNDDAHMGTFFGDDYETYAYITNQPKYFSVNWLIRIIDDTSVALVDDTTFRKLNADGINDDGSLLSASGLSPLTLTNLPTSDPEVLGAVWNDSTILKVSAG